MNYAQGLDQLNPIVFFVILIWSLFWRGLALWKAAQEKQKNWFIVLLVINTIGILDIAYLFFFAKKKMKLKELAFWNTK